MDFTDRTTASDAEFEARIAPFEAVPYAVELTLAGTYLDPSTPVERFQTSTSLRPVGSGGRRRDAISEEDIDAQALGQGLHPTPTELAGMAPATASPDRPFVHVTDDDVTVTRTPTAEQARAIDLLKINPLGLERPRLTVSEWRWVDRVVLGLGKLGVPAAKETAGA